MQACLNKQGIHSYIFAINLAKEVLFPNISFNSRNENWLFIFKVE